MSTEVLERPAPASRARPVAGRPPIGRWLLTGAVLAWFAALVLVPAGALVRQVWVAGWGPFAALWADPEVHRAFGLSLGIAAVATAINTVFGVAFAVVLARHRFRGKALADGLVDLPFAVSPVVAGLMLIVLFGPEGPIGGPLEAAGVRVIYALPGMVLATLFVTLPFVVRELVPLLQELGVEQEEAAYTLGAGRWTTFRRVTLPSIRWGLAYGVTLTVGRSLGEFGAVLVVSGNLVGQTQTATLLIHDGVESFRPQGAYAASVVLGGLSFVLLVGMDALRKRLTRTETEAEGARA
jgi:sulfate transport system permease protein